MLQLKLNIYEEFFNKQVGYVEDMAFSSYLKIYCVLTKHGGLDSRDQSRLRFIDLSRSTFETCREYPYCRDKIIFCLGRDF